MTIVGVFRRMDVKPVRMMGPVLIGPNHGSYCRGWPVGIEDNLLQSRNVKNSISKGKFSGPRPDSTKAMMLKLPVEEAVSDMTVSTWGLSKKA